MKKNIITLLLLSLISSFSFASNNAFQELVIGKYHSDDIITIINETVPEDVREAFIVCTEDDNILYRDTLRMYLLAIGQKESEWKYTRSHRANNNGTYDVGYLMLNENNILDPTFVRNFIPKPSDDYIPSNKQEFYLITCINFYKYLYNKYDCDASYAYNAGERRYIEGRIPSSTLKYKRDISLYLDEYIDRLYSMNDDRVEREMFFKELEKIHPLKLSEKIFLIKLNNTIIAFISANINSKNEIYVVVNKMLAIVPNDREYLRRVSGRKIVIIVTKTSDDCIVESYDDIDCYNIIIV